jgi:hypothetical protein
MIKTSTLPTIIVGTCQPTLLLAVIASACPPQPQPPAPPEPTIITDAATPASTADATSPADAGDAFDRACATLVLLHCAEGSPPAPQSPCATTMRRAEASGLTRTHPECVAAAKSVQQARACGSYCNRVVP